MNTISETPTHKVESAGTIYTPTKEYTERQWRDSELLRTDTLIVLPDYPRVKTTDDFKVYRQAVADWDSNPGFPDSELRPVWLDK